VLSYLRRRAQLRGLIGGARGWTILWAVLTGARVLKRLVQEEPKVVYTEELRPGQAIVIAHEDEPPSRRRRRA
jgi:hypothetical protein